MRCCKWKHRHCAPVFEELWWTGDRGRVCWGVAVVFTFPQNQKQRSFLEVLHTRLLTESGVAGQGKHFPTILPPRAQILSDFVSKTARSGQSWDRKTPRKTEVLQEAVWVNLAPGIFPSVWINIEPTSNHAVAGIIIVLLVEDGNPKVSANRVTRELKILQGCLALHPSEILTMLHPLKKISHWCN